MAPKKQRLWLFIAALVIFSGTISRPSLTSAQQSPPTLTDSFNQAAQEFKVPLEVMVITTLPIDQKMAWIFAIS